MLTIFSTCFNRDSTLVAVDPVVAMDPVVAVSAVVTVAVVGVPPAPLDTADATTGVSADVEGSIHHPGAPLTWTVKAVL